MTGASTMTATRAGKVKEGRDPSPSLKPVSSGSSDEVEPWDERPSTGTARDGQEPSVVLGDMMKSAVEFLGGAGAEDDRLEDGDLPTLSLKKGRVKGQYVSGERSTRPLSPPSTKGLEVDVKDNDPPMRRKRVQSPRSAKQAAAQRQFWSQLNQADSSFDQDDEDDQDRNLEGPDDEMAARRASRANELDNVPKQGDETVDGEDDYYRRNVGKANSYEEGGGTCIEYTLASIGDICGTGKSSASIKDSDRPAQTREIRELREDMVADDAEEHTAIEVEYVDPRPIPRRSPPSTPRNVASTVSPVATPTKKKPDKRTNRELPTSQTPDGESVELKGSEASASSSSRKNAVLAAMARKAKEDFEKHENEVSKQGSLPVSPRKVESSADHDNTSDIYNSFSPSEKRKFLKLINLGLTPTESTTRVVEERQNKDHVKNPGTSTKKRFSFWKKSAKVDAARSPPFSPRAPAVAKDAQSVSSTAAVGEAEDVVRPGESEAAMAPPDSPRRDEGSDAIVSKAYSPVAKDTSAIPTVAASPDSEDTPDELQVQEGNESGDMAAPESDDSGETEQEEHSRAVVAGVIAAGAAAVGVAAVTTTHQTADSASEAPVETTPPSSYEIDDGESSEEDDSVRGQFPRSGVNYYDGVRRELPEEEDSEDEFGEEMYPPTGKTSKASRLASLTGAMSPQSQGFSSLKESERNITNDDDSLSKQQKSISKSLSPLGRHSKSGGSSSKDISSPLSPGSASGRRRYLGIPILNAGKGFAPLEEDEDEDSSAAQSPQDNLVTNRDMQLPEEQLASAVAATAAVTTAVIAQKSQESGAPSEALPAPSTDDPFFGLESEEAVDAAKQPKNQDNSEVHNQALPKGQISEVDTSLDSYLDSATIQSYAGSHQDQGSIVTGSVISGRSSYTAGTGMTGHTQSSRKRRPGAAKQRIAKAKEADKSVPSKKGWHESIRAAAVTNNRVWDPQKGWVDYKDPNEGIQDTSNEKLHISLEGVSMRSPRATDNSQAGNDDSSRSPSVTVPFPSGWEEERNEMLSSGEAAKSSPRELSVPDLDESQKAPPVQGSISKVSNNSPKPRGWEASMREAAAEVSKDGQRWDPKLGWIGLDKDVLESSGLSPRKAPETDEDDDSTDDEGQKTSPSTIYAALIKAPSESKIRDAREFADSETRSLTSLSTTSRSQDVKLGNTVSPTPPATRDAIEHSTEDSSQPVVPGAGEKYVQLGENGSVKAIRRDTRKKKVSSEREDKHPFHPSTLRKGSASKATRPDTIYDDDDKAPLLTEDSSDSNAERGQTVKVVKEKVDEDDFSLFTANENSESVASPSRRRSTGPVDVDEVDDLDTETESEDGDEDGTWEPDSYMRGKVSPGMFVNPRNERSEELGGLAAAISPTRTPPKLLKSRRDTSPIRSVRGGKSIGESSKPLEAISPEASPRMVMSSPHASPGREDQSRTIEPSVSVGDDSVGSSSVKQLAQKWEIRAKHGTQIVHDQSGDSFEYDERQVTALGDFGPDTPEQQEWPDYYDKPPSQSTGNREWKSFLGKKVQAESDSAAAATLEETKRREGSLGAPKSGIPRAPGLPKRIPGSERATTDENGDSSVSFGDGPSDGDYESPAMSTSSAAARRRERALQQSSPGGFSDVSPIPPREDSFGVDDARMERVSDTGTAVEQSSFMKRLSACAAPLSRAFTQNGANGLPSSHLDFMRTNPAAQSSPNSAGRFVPAGMCGKHDIINEDEESDEDDSKRSLDHKEMEMEPSPTSPTSQILKEVKQRSSSRGRAREDPMANVGNDASSSVASEDFGARTSYLEAIALRSAVSSGSRKSRRRRRSQDSRSTVSDATTESKLSHSERWQAFLERKASQTASPPDSRAQSSTEISRAAERYASEKMEEMLEVMASRSKSTPRSWRSEDKKETLETSYGDSSNDSPLSPYQMTATDGDRSMSSKKTKTKKKSESAKAAEELAAARVEAMMAAMTSSNLDEGEI